MRFVRIAWLINLKIKPTMSNEIMGLIDGFDALSEIDKPYFISERAKHASTDSMLRELTYRYYNKYK